MNYVVVTGFIQDQIHEALWANDEHFGREVPRIGEGEDSWLTGRFVDGFGAEKIDVTAELLKAIGIMGYSPGDPVDLRSDVFGNEQDSKRRDCLLAVAVNKLR